MRHRIGGIGTAVTTGLGNPSQEILGNKGKLTADIKKCLDEAIKIFPLLKELEGCDYDISDNIIKFGIEPAYQFQKLEVIQITRTKENSFWETGIAFGAYGSGIRSKRRYYGEYKNKGKFVKFIDKWHSELFTN